MLQVFLVFLTSLNFVMVALGAAEKPIWIDVRTANEFQSGHVPGAKWIDIYASDFEQQIKKLDREKLYFVYCRSGSRSSQALSLMKSWGFQKVENQGSKEQALRTYQARKP